MEELEGPCTVGGNVNGAATAEQSGSSSKNSKVLPYGLCGFSIKQLITDSINLLTTVTLLMTMKHSQKTMQVDYPHGGMQRSITREPEFFYQHGGRSM
ncbi:hypothetical protein DF277_15745 [Listeria monocytogenes]|nr:hypothetical protein DF277_15745 [Listeria monocytogenes]